MFGLGDIQLLVLQPTPFCNLDCTYCYLPHRRDRRVMPAEVLDDIGRVIVASPAFTEATTVVWHAGEPCVLKPQWYREARRRIEAAAGRRLGEESFQTNATLIDDAWIDHFRTPGVRVGVSLDGPAALHDRHRRTRAGGGTHAAAQRGIARLRRAGIPFHIIAVVTAASLEAPEAMAAALADTGAEWIGLNIEEIDGSNRGSSLAEGGAETGFRRFFDRFLDELARHRTAPRLREVDRFYQILAQGPGRHRARHQENAPGAIVSVGVDGGVSTFSPELLGLAAPRYGGFRFGTLGEMTDISEMYLSAPFRRVHGEIRAGIAACRQDCAHFGVCGGGSPANKLGECGRLDATETMQCRLTVKATLEALLARSGTMEVRP